MKSQRFVLFAALAVLLPVAAWGLTAHQRIVARQARHQVDEGVNFFSNVLSAKVDNYWHKGDYEDCVRILKLQIELDPHWIEPYDQAAWLLWSMQRFDEAEALYKEGIAHNPDSYRLYFELAHMYHRTAYKSLYKTTPEESRELYEKAVAQLRIAVEKSPCPSDVKRLLAHTLIDRLGRKEEGRKVLQDILKDDPNDKIARRELNRLDQELKTEAEE